MVEDEVLALTVSDACTALSVGKTTLYSLIAAGLIDARRLGGRTIIPATSLRGFLAGLPAAPIRSKPTCVPARLLVSRPQTAGRAAR